MSKAYDISMLIKMTQSVLLLLTYEMNHLSWLRYNDVYTGYIVHCDILLGCLTSEFNILLLEV